MRIVLITLAATLATIMLTMSYPRLISSLNYLPVQAALNHHWKDYPIKTKQFPALIETAKNSINKQNEARYWQGLAWLYYLQATSKNQTIPEAKKSLNNAQTALETFLKKSPSSPAEWLRLAWTHELQKHKAEKIVETLKMSFYTGRAERYLMPNRLELALRYADKFNEADKKLIADQILLTWRFHKIKMKKYIKNGTYNLKTINILLNNNPELK